MDETPKAESVKHSGRKSSEKGKARRGTAAFELRENGFVEEQNIPEAVTEQEIDAMVASFASARLPVKSGKRGRQKNQRAHIASNPSVNPIQTKTIIVDGVKVANTRIHRSVEEEMKSHGIKKLPTGISMADLAIPSYDSVVTAAERRPLDCAIFHEFQEDGQLSPLDEMMRKSQEKNSKNRKNSRKEEKCSKKDGKKGSKDSGKCDLCDEKGKCTGKCEKKSGKESGKSEKECGKIKSEGKQEKERKKGKKGAKAEKVLKAETLPTAEGNAPVMPIPGMMPGNPYLASPQTPFYPQQPVPPAVPLPPMAGAAMPVPPPMAGSSMPAPPLDPSVRNELLKQQEMLWGMIQQCHQALAAIHSQLMAPSAAAFPPVPGQPVPPMPLSPAMPVPILPGTGIYPNSISVSVAETAFPAEIPAETAMNALGNSGPLEAMEPSRRPSRRERLRLKKLRGEAEQAAENVLSDGMEKSLNAKGTIEDEKGVSLETFSQKERRNSSSGSDSKTECAERMKSRKESREKENGATKKNRKKTISDLVAEYPDEFVSFSDDVDFSSGKSEDETSGKKKQKTERHSEKKGIQELNFDENVDISEENEAHGLTLTENFTADREISENRGEISGKGKKSAKGSKSLKDKDISEGKNPAKSSSAGKTDKSAKNGKSLKKEERYRLLKDSEFGKMGLSKELLLALDDAQYVTPSRIQQAFIPEALTGNDVMGQAQTGTGKTAAFTIPILQMIEFDEDSFDPQALILVPTRELAVQVKDEIEKLAKYSDLECVALYGGKPLAPQVQQLRAGVDIVVGTPGRIMDHIKRGSLKLRNLKISILDEADRMLDIGFRPDIEKILRMAPQSRQSLLLSATIPPSVESIARKYMREPKLVDCSQKDISSETIEQFYFTVDPELKFDLLLKLLEREKPQQAIIFCRTKRGVERIANRLTKEISSVESIHGDLQQRKRDRVMASFRSGKTRFLVATDVVGRGIDVSGISHIINYDIPKFCDDYVHRVGRTGRMGHEGVAFTFVAPEEGNELTRIEMRINQLLKRDEIPGFSGLPTMTAVPPLEIAQDEEEKKLPRRRRRL